MGDRAQRAQHAHGYGHGKWLIGSRGVTLALHKLGLRHGATAAGFARHEAA